MAAGVTGRAAFLQAQGLDAPRHPHGAFQVKKHDVLVMGFGVVPRVDHGVDHGTSLLRRLPLLEVVLAQ